MSRNVWTRANWQDTRLETEELYDLILDPCEKNNLASKPEHADTLDELRHALRRFMADTRDPLLTGALPCPENAVVTPAEKWIQS